LTLAPGVIMMSAPAGLLNSHLEKELASLIAFICQQVSREFVEDIH